MEECLRCIHLKRRISVHIRCREGHGWWPKYGMISSSMSVLREWQSYGRTHLTSGSLSGIACIAITGNIFSEGIFIMMPGKYQMWRQKYIRIRCYPFFLTIHLWTNRTFFITREWNDFFSIHWKRSGRQKFHRDWGFYKAVRPSAWLLWFSFGAIIMMK